MTLRYSEELELSALIPTKLSHSHRRPNSSNIPIVIDHAKVRETVSILYGQDAQRQHGARSCFDPESSCVAHPEYLELELDFIFSQLGLANERELLSPILMTETPCHPLASREMCSEILFECYNAPAVSFGIDSLFSYNYNSCDRQNGLIISAGHNATHIIPIFDTKFDSSNAKRLAVGGKLAVESLQRMLLLKYPGFPAKISQNLSRSLLYQHSYIATEFLEELEMFAADDWLEQKTVCVQFPFVEPVKPSPEELAETERKRQAQRDRMREHMARKRDEKLALKRQQLSDFEEVLSLETMDKTEFKEGLVKLGFKDGDQLRMEINDLKKYVVRIEAKIQGIELPEEPKQVPSWPLVDIPDGELDENQLKEKRKQRLLKAGWDARQKIHQEKEAMRVKKLEEEKLEEEKRLAGPQKWLEDLYEKRVKILRRIRERKELTAQLADRKSAASQARLKALTSLIETNDDTNNNIAGVTGAAVKKRKRKQTSVKSTNNEDDDNFGENDDDWMIYHDIKNEESEDEDQIELERLEASLLQFDPHFDPNDVADHRRTLYHRLKYGPEGYIKPDDLAGHYQMRLNVERIRVPELLFQPCIVGLDHAGIPEIIQTILRQYPVNAQQSMVENVFITGSFAQIPGFKERVGKELRMIRPFESTFSVKTAKNMRLDAWRGASQWAQSVHRSNQINKVFITRSEYEELGSGYLKEHYFSNKYLK